jgi:hypothetical protein
MFGWRKKNKDAEAQDAFGQTDVAPVQVHSSSDVTVRTTQASDHPDPAMPAQLGGLLGALHDAMEESGGDPAKLPQEIKENLAERGIQADVQTSDSPTVITSSFGSMFSPEDATLARLEKLGQLKAQGLLTDEEFAAQKARILGS